FIGTFRGGWGGVASHCLPSAAQRRYVGPHSRGDRCVGQAPIIPAGSGRMIRSQVRAQVAANQPEAAKSDAGLGGQAVKAAEIPAPEIDRPAVIAGRPSPSWLVRNPRKAALAMVVIAIAAAPFTFRYLQREFGPDPLVGIKLDDVKPALSAAPFIEPAPKPLPPRPAVAPARAVVAAPVAAVPMAPSPGVTPSLGVSPSSGVTHTRPGGAVQAGPEASAAT